MEFSAKIVKIDYAYFIKLIEFRVYLAQGGGGQKTFRLFRGTLCSSETPYFSLGGTLTNGAKFASER